MGLERRRDTCDDIYFHYLNQYLTFEALDSGTFTLTIGSGVSTSILTSVSYSVDSGETWTTTNNTNNTQVVITTPTIAQGHNVLWKGIGVSMANSQLVFGTAAANRLPLVSNFTSSGRYSISGNIMSLLYGDNFLANKEFAEGSSHNFALLFYKTSADNKLVSAKNMIFPARKCPNYAYFRIFQMNSGLEYSPVISATEVHSHGCCNLLYKCSSLKTFPKRLASNLYGDSNYKYAFFGCDLMTKTPEMPASTVPTSGYAYAFGSCIALTEASDLPATTLSRYSYSCMFYNCTALTKAPEISATTLANSCCNAMFCGCVSLTKSPDLPATTLADNCYYNMFSGCTSLVDVPDSLPALVVPLGAYYQMFEECTSLTRTPNLSGQTIGNYGYGIMFAGCSSLVDVTPLNAYNLSYASYAYMFYGCTSLTDAPALPAETLGEWCYGHMFDGCTSLVNAPLLPAKKLVSACYRTMFGGCTNLRYVKCLAEDLGQSESSNPLLSWMSNVPSGGTFYKMNGVTWPRGASGVPNGWDIVDSIVYENEYLTFEALESGTFSFTIPSGVSTKSITSISYSTDDGNTWNTTNNVNNTEVVITTPAISQGNKVLWKGISSQLSVSAQSSIFSSSGLFNVYGNLISLFLGDNFTGKTTLGSGGRVDYYAKSIFSNSKVVNAANLILIKNYGLSVYEKTFNGCTNLISAPAIQPSSVYQSSHEGMFKGCTSLTKAPDLLSSSIGARSYYSMFSGCTSLNYVKCLATSRSTNNPIAAWLAYVSPTGTFVKAQGATDWPSGANGIPTGWTVVDYSSDEPIEYSYIQKGLVFQLDGIDYGGVDGHWIEKKNGYDFYEHEGTNLHTEDNCMVFDGNSWFLCDDTISSYPDSTYSIEVCTNSLRGWNSIINIRLDNVAVWADVDYHVYGARGANKPRITLNSYASGPHHLYVHGSTFVFDGGVMETSGTGTRSVQSSPIIGALESGNASTYHSGNGVKIYSIRIYNRALTPEEIYHNYKGDRIRFNF